ncbi:carboxy terminal-processing peptidase [Zooshikella ganghwensis]|uniref:carboxy terminal-processing peptidase n=1 Tax=Zooshikella ganghwensis TaxID=202772 RepID=UPI0004258E3B|nr:carboxy terminal-processing peptidase [Zooshikella ganghwensis]
MALNLCKSKLLNALLFTTMTSLSLATIAKVIPAEQLNLQELTPTEDQRLATVNMVQLLRRHYEKIPLNDQSSVKIFDRYLETLDPDRRYFLLQDINEFEKYRHKLDNDLKTGNLRHAFEMFNRYQARVKQHLLFNLKLLKRGVSRFNFAINETLETDRKNAHWTATHADQQSLWRKILKDRILRLRLAGKEDKEIVKLLTKRFNNQLNRLHQNNNEDAYQIFVNAFTQIYDPHTQYFSPRRAENFDINMSLKLEGIGAVLQSEDEYTKVVRLVNKGPADKAGQLKPADKIVGVGQGTDGEIVDVIGWRLDEVVELIRGKKDTIVRLEVIPSGSDTTGPEKVYSIKRDTVKLEEQSAQKKLFTIKEKGKSFKVGIIQIPTFYIDFKSAQAGEPEYKSTTRDVKRLLKELEKEKVDGLVIDLRNNGGGSLQEANELTGLFIKQGPTVVVKDSLGRVDTQEDPDGSIYYDGPMVVLVNRLSASASEIFAGAMQDYRRALVVGSQTFGKGTVQSIQPLNHGQLKYTLAKFYRVSGQSTQHQGIMPDIHFPAVYNTEEIGESSLPDALPWDTIKPVRHTPYQANIPEIMLLQKKHNQRIQISPDFIYIQDQLNYQRELEKQTKISLNQKQRQEELQQRQEQRLAMENTFRKAKGKDTYKSYSDFEEAAEKESLKEQEDLPVEDDAYLFEAGNVLVDYVQLKQRIAANDSVF